MKSFLSYLIAFVMIFSLIGCGGGAPVADDPASTSDAEMEEDETDMDSEAEGEGSEEDGV